MINYDNTSEGFKSHDPYELMIIPPNKKAEMIMKEIKKSKPNLNLVSDLIVLGANLEWEDEDNEGFAPLHLAVKLGGVETVRMLIGAGANVNAHKWGWTPLHWAARRGEVDIARILIDAGANLDLQDDNGNTPLHLAVLKGQVEIVRMLIGANANLNVQDNDGWTPLHLAARRGSIGNVEVTRILIDAGARKDIPNYEGKLPYDLADTYEFKNLLQT